MSHGRQRFAAVAAETSVLPGKWLICDRVHLKVLVLCPSPFEMAVGNLDKNNMSRVISLPEDNK